MRKAILFAVAGAMLIGVGQTVGDITGIVAPDDLVFEFSSRDTVYYLGEPTVTGDDPTETYYIEHNGPGFDPANPFYGSSFDVGGWGLVWSGTDADGNMRTDDQYIEVRDTTAPTITLPATLDVYAASPAGILGSDLLSAALATVLADDLYDPSPTITPITTGWPADYSSTMLSVGSVLSIGYRAEDMFGNASSAFQDITVIDPSVVPRVDQSWQTDGFQLQRLPSTWG